MVTTGYTDTFNRTVANGLGSADSGQAYTLFGVATQFSVAPSTAQIAITSVGDKIGYIDLQTSDVDITAQVALSGVPATNLATAGFAAKLSTTSNYYVGSMMVATGGAMSLRFSKVVGGGLSTLSTTSLGLSYVANTFYNLRFSVRWSQALQTNILQLRLWAVGSTEPGGWMATTTDASHTQYSAGTNVGIHGRDESTVSGTITTKYRSLASYSYHLPMPATTDPMCYDPSIPYPKQTALESLADAVDVVVATLDPLTSLAELYPRVRVSTTNFTITGSLIFITPTFNATEFNIGTPTNLGQDSAGIYLSPGLWLVTFEMRLANAASDSLSVTLDSSALGSAKANMRSNASQSNDESTGGTIHVTQYAQTTDPTSPTRIGVTIQPVNTAATYTASYMALSAVQVSEYFT